jgi:hypothetical protein
LFLSSEGEELSSKRRAGTDWESRNVLALKIFGPLLIAAGVLGFVLPPELSLMSAAVPYGIFHLAFGALAVVIVIAGTARAAALFNAGFGAFDLYQAIAGVTGWFPAGLFALRPADHVVHVIFGLALLVVGVFGLRGADSGRRRSVS